MVPLEYRFKHFERRLVYNIRGVRQHKLLPRCLLVMYPARARAKAKREATLAEGNPDNLSFATKQCIRASDLLEFYGSNTALDRMEQACTSTKHTQVYMNAAFAAETHSTKYREELKAQHLCP